MRSRSGQITAALLAATLVAAIGLLSIVFGNSHAPEVKRPNIIVIQTDDQTLNQLDPRTMPNLHRLLAGHGSTFPNYIVTDPQCCPSRASLITGQYAHNHGIISNGPGYPDLKDPQNVLPVWLQNAGYVTANVGKFLNGFGKGRPTTAEPPGWDEWYWTTRGEAFYDYEIAINGEVRRYGTQPRDYLTTVIDDQAVDLIHKYLPGDQPLYLQLNERAPHTSPGHRPCLHAAIPAPGDLKRFRDTQLPDVPSVNERNVADKPDFIRRLPPLDRTVTGRVLKHFRCALGSLREVDRGIGQVWQAVKEAGALQDTVFIFISDNGYFNGQHRISAGKALPYEESIHIPMFMRVPRDYRDDARRVPRVHAPVANIDIAPTIVDLAHACDSGECRVMDGRSLMPLVDGHQAEYPRRRPLLIEFDSRPATNNAICTWNGVWQPSEVFVHYSYVARSRRCVKDDQYEYYNLRRDPYELRNLARVRSPAPTSDRERRLEKDVSKLEDCAGIEGRDPRPESGHYCD